MVLEFVLIQIETISIVLKIVRLCEKLLPWRPAINKALECFASSAVVRDGQTLLSPSGMIGQNVRLKAILQSSFKRPSQHRGL